MPRRSSYGNRPRYNNRQQYRRSYYPGNRSYFRRRVYGSGSYTVKNGPFARVGGYIGRAIGTYAGGGPAGGRIGDWLGRRLLHYPARLFGSGAYYRRPYRRTIRGHGDYSVSDTVKMAPEVPTFSRKGDYVEIAHREYIGDIISSSVAGATKIYKYAITPGESATFPWLASIAQPDFQQFKFDGCMFQFQSFSSDSLNSTNTALGAVVAGIDYDFTQDDFTNRAQVENLQWSTSCKPSCSTEIPVECASNKTALGGGLLYVLNAAGTPSNVDLKTYMLGKLYVLTTGVQGTSVNLGSLYVTYKIRLYKPMIQAPLSNANIVKLYRTGCTGAAPYGTATTQTLYTCDTLGCSFTGNVMTILTDRLIPGARYLMVHQWVGASTALLSDPGSGSSLVGGSLPGWAINPAGTLDVDNVISNPASGGVTDVQITSVAEFQVNDTVAQTGFRYTLSTGGTVPTGATLMVYVIQRNGLDTRGIGYFTGY